MPSRVLRRVTASASPNTSLNRSCALCQSGLASLNLILPRAVVTTWRRRRSSVPSCSAISPSRSSGRRLWPRADRSMTRAWASSAIVGGAAARRSSSARMANCVERRPDWVSASSNNWVNRRDALRIVVALQALSRWAMSVPASIVYCRMDISGICPFSMWLLERICEPVYGYRGRLRHRSGQGRRLVRPLWEKANQPRATSRGDDVQGHVDVAARGLGVRADFVRGVNDRLGDVARHARHTDVEPGLDEIGIAGLAQIHLDLDRQIRRKLHLLLLGHEPDRGDEEGRPCAGEQLLCGRMRLDGRKQMVRSRLLARRRELDVEAAVLAAYRRVRLTGEQDIFDLGHESFLIGLAGSDIDRIRVHCIKFDRMRCQEASSNVGRGDLTGLMAATGDRHRRRRRRGDAGTQAGVAWNRSCVRGLAWT